MNSLFNVCFPNNKNNIAINDFDHFFDDFKNSNKKDTEEVGINSSYRKKYSKSLFNFKESIDSNEQIKINTTRKDIDDINNQKIKKLVISNYKHQSTFDHKNEDSISSPLLDNDQHIVINANGMNDSKRLSKDGYTYFGISPTYKALMNIQILDVILHLNNQHKLLNSSNVIFCIRFDKDLKSYFIETKFEETDRILLFIKVRSFFKLNSRNIIAIGNVLLSLEINSNNSLIISEINKEDKSKIINCNEYNESNPLRVGRKEYNDICINNKSLSRTHCLLYFRKDDNSWILTDGNGDSSSSNGTWIYLNGTNIIKDGDIIRINNSYLVLSLECKD